MLELLLPVYVGLGCGRSGAVTRRRRERATRIKDLTWVNVLAAIGERIVWWWSAVVRSMMGAGGRRSDIRSGPRRPRVVTDGDGGGADESGGGAWVGDWLRRASPRDGRANFLAAEGFLVGAGGVSVQGSAHGLLVTANAQTLRNRDVGQLGQTQKWLKRYKTGMFANLANLANQICKISG